MHTENCLRVINVYNTTCMQYFLNICMFIRKQRLAEMKQYQQVAKFGEMMEITAVDYVQEINKAGEGIWVILHLYKTG